jgi:hypothetical protein
MGKTDGQNDSKVWRQVDAQRRPEYDAPFKLQS